MTQRELMNAIIAKAEITEDMIETAKSVIASMDKANLAKKSKTSEKRATEIAPIIEKVVEFLKGKAEPTLGTEIAEFCEVSASKITPILKGMDNIEVVDVKVKGKGVRKAYRLIEGQSVGQPLDRVEQMFGSFSFCFVCEFFNKVRRIGFVKKITFEKDVDNRKKFWYNHYRKRGKKYERKIIRNNRRTKR